MSTIGKSSKKAPAAVLDEAATFFGPGGAGLKLKDRQAECITFEGGGGFVKVSAAARGKGADVNIESKEWDFWVQRFLDKI